MITPRRLARGPAGPGPGVALRATGFQGFNCNLELVGQVRGDGARTGNRTSFANTETRSADTKEIMEIGTITLAPTMALLRRRLARRLAARRQAFRSST